MSGRRSTTPLFELLQQGRVRPIETHLPEADAKAPAPAARSSPEPQGMGLSEAPIRIVGGVVQMPLMYGAVAVVVALVAVAVAWTLGYTRGENEVRSEQRLLESALGPGSQVVEPGTAGGSGDQAAIQQPVAPDNAIQTQSKSQGNRVVPTVGQGRFLTQSGSTETNPRVPMHNYLQLGSLIRRSEVESAIAFLDSRGLECFGVIDPSTLGRNDGPLYVLFAGLGFPSGEANSPEARRYREQVLAAGTAWKRAGGVKNFDDAGWALHRP